MLCILIAQIESAQGVRNCEAIAEHEAVCGLGFGALDYARSMNVGLSSHQHEMDYPRARIAVAARAAGLHAFDLPWFELQDEELLREQTERVRDLGFSGKFVIHPRQIDIVNDVFTPGKEQIIEAHKVVDAYEFAQKRSKGSVRLDGKMVDRASYERAKDVIELIDRLKKNLT